MTSLARHAQGGEFAKNLGKSENGIKFRAFVFCAMTSNFARYLAAFL